MPVHLEVSRLDRQVVIVARGHVTPDEIRAQARSIADAEVRHFAKIIDVSGATSEIGREQVESMAAGLRSAPGAAGRGPIAFVNNPDRVGFAEAFAEMTEGDRPVRLFRSIHDARKWLEGFR